MMYTKKFPIREFFRVFLTHFTLSGIISEEFYNISNKGAYYV